VEVRPVEPGEERAAADLLTEAFMDDPGWCAVGPRSESRRRKMLKRFFRAHMGVARRWGGPTYGAFDRGAPVGALISFAEGRFPPPPQSMLLEGPGMVAAGPGTLIRALRGQAALEAGHPEDPHVFVSMLGVDPGRQRTGAGRALLGRVLAQADSREVPVYLDTANPDNLPYYASFGFELQGEAKLPRDATIWYLLRPVPGALASV
jgi:GNAT superfamily N-acetyltransferase